MKFHINKTIQSDFDTAMDKAKSAITEEGFGVVSEIDLSAKIKGKLGIDYPRYHILGACNPAYAHKALQVEPLIGTMLPCNVILRDAGNGNTEIAAVDPVVSMAGVENEDLTAIAREIREKLERVINSL